MTRLADPGTVPGLSESRLSPADLAALPASAPAPWVCQARAITWIQRAHSPAFDWQGRPLPLAMVTFVDYLDTPVGPYHEVLAGAILRPGRRVGALPALQVPFIAVDSLASVHGGRANWALPKTMGRFEFDLLAGRAHAEGDGWSFRVQPARRAATGSVAPPPRLPLRVSFRSTGPLGRGTTTLRARSRPILVRSEAIGPALTGWLGSGHHLAFVSIGQMRVGAPDSRP